MQRQLRQITEGMPVLVVTLAATFAWYWWVRAGATYPFYTRLQAEMGGILLCAIAPFFLTLRRQIHPIATLAAMLIVMGIVFKANQWTDVNAGSEWKYHYPAGYWWCLAPLLPGLVFMATVRRVGSLQGQRWPYILGGLLGLLMGLLGGHFFAVFQYHAFMATAPPYDPDGAQLEFWTLYAPAGALNGAALGGCFAWLVRCCASRGCGKIGLRAFKK